MILFCEFCFVGIRVKYDILQPKENRVVSLEILCHKCNTPVYEHVAADKIYPLLINTFMRRGGDGYDVIKEKAMNVQQMAGKANKKMILLVQPTQFYDTIITE